MANATSTRSTAVFAADMVAASPDSVSLARRLASAFPNATLKLVENARLFVSIDAPGAVAEALGAFVPRVAPRAPERV